MAWASSSTWKYSTEVRPFSCRIVVPLINCRAQISRPSTKIAWSGDTRRSVCGMLSANAPRWMRIGATVSGRGCVVRSMRRRPIHLTGSGLSSSPASVSTMSPCIRVSTIRSPVAVRIRVPAAKQTASIVSPNTAKSFCAPVCSPTLFIVRTVELPSRHSEDTGRRVQCRGVAGEVGTVEDDLVAPREIADLLARHGGRQRRSPTGTRSRQC